MENAIERMHKGGIEVNVSDVEHVGALITGGLMLGVGLRRGGFLGTVFGIVGGALLYRGQKGYRRLYDLIGVELPMQPTGVGIYNVRVESEVAINLPAKDIYRIWRNLENLPVFMDHLVSVMELDDDYSHWVARGPLGVVVKWDARIINDIEDKLIAWESLEGSGIDSAGSVHFDPINEEWTRVRVVLRYDPPAEHLGTMISKLFRTDPQAQIDKDLQRFKRILESSRLEQVVVSASLM